MSLSSGELGESASPMRVNTGTPVSDAETPAFSGVEDPLSSNTSLEELLSNRPSLPKVPEAVEETDEAKDFVIQLNGYLTAQDKVLKAVAQENVALRRWAELQDKRAREISVLNG